MQERMLQNDSTCQIGCCEGFKDTLCVSSENQWLNALPFAVQIMLMTILTLLSALFSGLTLGLMGLDKTGLEIVMGGEDESSARAARKIYPVRSNGNLLLCTLLLGNVLVNSMLSILFADKAGGLVGLLASTILIVIFGEIVPQALCSRYALQIGSKTVPLVRVIMILLYPIAAPLAFVLNKVLGNELATTYSSAEMRKLLEIHVKEGRFDQETAEAMTGALKYKEIAVKDAMTPLEYTFMLNADEKLSFQTIATIFKTGYSRIPVYEVSVNNIIGLLFVKDLIFIDPEDDTPVRNFVQIFGRGVHVVWPDDKLGDVLRELKQGRSHMALVRDVNNEDEKDPFYEIKGIITLEDVIEEIIGDEIVDETDAFVDGTHSVKVSREEGFDWGRLRLLDTKIVERTLSYEETRAVTAHLRANYAESVGLLTDRQLHRLIGDTSVTELPAAEQDVGMETPEDLIYQQGVQSDVCTLILSGKVTVLAGKDKFRSDVSSWTVLAASALKDSSYVPDFTAFVSSGPCRCIQLNQAMFAAAVDASVIERRTTPAKSSPKMEDDSKGKRNAAKLLLDDKSLRGSKKGSDKRLTDSSNNCTPSPNRAGTKREENQSRRRKLIDAFLEHHSKEFQPAKEEETTTTQEDEQKTKADQKPEEREHKRVAFGIASDRQKDLNHLLSDGGTYQPKRRASTSDIANTSTKRENLVHLQKIGGSSIEFLEADSNGEFQANAPDSPPKMKSSFEVE